MRRPSPSLVISLIALFVALGGTGYAAIKIPRNSVKAKQIAPGAVQSSEAKNLKLGDFKKSERGKLKGPAGARGPLGPVGPAGPRGTTTIGAIQGNTDTTLDPLSSSEETFSPSGYSEAENPTGYQSAPNVPIEVSDLFARLGTAPGAGRSRTFNLRSFAGRIVLSCTVADTATTCNSGSARGTLAPGEQYRMSIFTSPTAPAASQGAQWAFRASTP